MQAQSPWWAQAGTISSADVCQQPEETTVEWYRFGAGTLALEADDFPLRQRLSQVYGECALSASPSPTEHHMKCTVQSLTAPALVSVTCTDSVPLDAVAFLLHLFQDRGYVELPPVLPDWRLLGKAGRSARPLLAARRETMLVDRSQPWQAFVANYMLNRVLRLQRERLFFHAASVGIQGAGILLTGAKGAGKSTLSLALAARGHAFLGDGLAAVHQHSGEMLPFRRAVSIRTGLRAQRVDERLRSCPTVEECFPDGTTRLRARIQELFPTSGAQPVPLRSAIFLRQFAPRPCLERFTPSLQHLRFVQPLGCTMWDVSPGRRLIAFLQMLSRARCYFLDVGLPETTADLIESTVEGA